MEGPGIPARQIRFKHLLRVSCSQLPHRFHINSIASLMIGFTFFKAKDTIQGTQNKLFVGSLPQVLIIYR